MRILFLTGEFPSMQGGVGDCTNEIAQALAARGVDVCVLTSTQAQSADLRRSSFVVRPVMRHWGWSSYRLISQTIREFNPDLVHIQFQTAAFGMHPAIYFLPRYLASSLTRSQRGRVRVGVTFHDLLPPYLFPKAGPVREWFTQSLARSCDAVVATNDEDYLKLEAWGLRPALIPIGSNISTTQSPNYQAAAWRKKLGVNESESLLCYFGFLNERKGGETLVRALAQVPNAKLLMIGGQVGASDSTNAAYLARVKALIGELGLSERVLWTDYTPPEIVTANFMASDVCVMPYRDGASYRRGTLMAALAHGCAIVTTVASRQSSVVSHQPSITNNQSPISNRTLPALADGMNCLLVEPDNPGALADAIHRAIAAPELRARIGAGARELALNFTWEKIAQQHLDLYRRILK